MSRPKLLMLDEPSLGLAPMLVDQTLSMIEEINKQGVTVFLVEQNVDRALTLAHKGYLLENGQITIKGPGKELLRNPYIKEAYLGL